MGHGVYVKETALSEAQPVPLPFTLSHVRLKFTCLVVEGIRCRHDRANRWCKNCLNEVLIQLALGLNTAQNLDQAGMSKVKLLSVHPPMHVHIYLAVYLSVCLSVYICLSTYLSA
jgi:hypothetical protein